MKYIPTIIILMGLGCTTNRTDFEPLPPKELYDNLLFETRLQNLAYKSITIKEIIGEKDFN